MEIREADEQKYSKLDLHELARLIKGFLIKNDYRFVRAAYLYSSVEQARPYALLFEVPKDSVPEDLAGLYTRFKEDLCDRPSLSLTELRRVYRDRESADSKAIDEWMWWSVADGKDIEGEGLHDFVLSDEPVIIYSRHTVTINVDLFPELRFATLKSYADEWAKKWPVIRKVTLFRYSPFAPRQIRGVPVKYVLLFEIAGKDADLEFFEKATNCFRTIRDEYGDGILYEDFMAPAFETVYRQGAAEGYQKEWRLDPKREGTEAFHYESNPSWLLFDPDAELITPSPEIIPRELERPVKVADSPAPAQTPADSKEREDNYFVLDGEYWDVGFGDEKGKIRNLQDIRYIIHLVSNAGMDISCSELTTLVRKSNEDPTALYGKETEASLRTQGESLSGLTEEQWGEKGMNLNDVGADVLTEEDRDALKTAADKLIEKLNEAQRDGNGMRVTKANEELKKFQKYCMNEYGLRAWIKDGGFVFSKHQMKRANPDAEKARQNVKNQIRKALQRIKQKLPRLAEHLDARISRGTNCAYVPLPEDHIGEWHITGI